MTYIDNEDIYKSRKKYNYIGDIPNLENYLALYLCIKPIKENSKKNVSKKKYLTSAEALRLMGLDVKECRKVKEISNYNGKI